VNPDELNRRADATPASDIAPPESGIAWNSLERANAASLPEDALPREARSQSSWR
jgi:hypothetical protein